MSITLFLHWFCVNIFVCRLRHKRVFETVKNINQSVRQRSPAPPTANIPGSNQTHSSLSSALSDGNTDNLAALDNREQSMLLEAESTDAKWVVLNTQLLQVLIIV